MKTFAIKLFISTFSLLYFGQPNCAAWAQEAAARSPVVDRAIEWLKKEGQSADGTFSSGRAGPELPP